MNNKFIKSVLTLAGVIIGVGTFAIPYAVAQSGIFMGIIFLIALTGIMIMVHLMYGEIILRTKSKHRFPGYAKKYLPKSIGTALGVIPVISLVGVLLIYLIVGGKFLTDLTEPFVSNTNTTLSTLIFFIIGSVVIFKDKKIFSRAEEIFTLGIILVAIIIFIIGFSEFRLDNIHLDVIRLDKSFLLYGIMFFSLTGLSAIPEIREFFREKQGAIFKKSIIVGTIIPAVFYLIFMMGVIGISGVNTTDEAISGLGRILGDEALLLGSMLGFFATITSFWAVGLTLKKIFWYDYGMNKYIAWGIACFVPLALYLIGVTNFIPVIEVVGGILGGIEGSILVAVYLRAKKQSERIPEYSLNVPNFVFYCVPLMFTLVIVYELMY